MLTSWSAGADQMSAEPAEKRQALGQSGHASYFLNTKQ